MTIPIMWDDLTDKAKMSIFCAMTGADEDLVTIEVAENYAKSMNWETFPMMELFVPEQK